MDGSALFNKDLRELARECQQRLVEFGQVRIQSVIARAPACRSFIRREVEHREVACRTLSVAQLRELFTDIGGSVLTDDPLTLIDRQNGSKHTLVFGVGLAKVKGWHT